MRALSLLALAALTVATPADAQRPASRAVRVFVEGFREADTLTREAAILLRVELQRRAPDGTLDVMTTQVIDAQRSSGLPDDWGGTWNWADVRQSGWAYRAEVIVDVTAVRSAPGVGLQARLIRPPKTGPIVELPIVHGPSLPEAVDLLARRLVASEALHAPR